METLHNTYYIYLCQEYGYLLQRNAFYKTLKFSDFTLSDLCHYMHSNFSLIQIEIEGGKTHTLLNNGYLQTHINNVAFHFAVRTEKQFVHGSLSMTSLRNKGNQILAMLKLALTPNRKHH